MLGPQNTIQKPGPNFQTSPTRPDSEILHKNDFFIQLEIEFLTRKTSSQKPIPTRAYDTKPYSARTQKFMGPFQLYKVERHQTRQVKLTDLVKVELWNFDKTRFMNEILKYWIGP